MLVLVLVLPHALLVPVLVRSRALDYDRLRRVRVLVTLVLFALMLVESALVRTGIGRSAYVQVGLCAALLAQVFIIGPVFFIRLRNRRSTRTAGPRRSARGATGCSCSSCCRGR